MASEVVSGDGYSVAADLEAFGEGPGFRKLRRDLDIKEFGVNAIVIPAGYDTGFHYHDTQEELYFVHSGEIEIRFNDDTSHRLGAGGTARVDAPVHRAVKNVGEGEATYIVVGAKDGYVGRDGRDPESD